jgi:hypothetical protein
MSTFKSPSGKCLAGARASSSLIHRCTHKERCGRIERVRRRRTESSLGGDHDGGLTRPAPKACLARCPWGLFGGLGRCQHSGRQVVDDCSVGRVTKDQAETLLQGASRGDATTFDSSRRNPRPVPWDWIDIGADDQTLRIEFIHGVVDGLHHVEVYEDDQHVRVTVFIGLDPDVRTGAYVALGLTAWTTETTTSPVGRRRIVDGAEQ